MNAPNHFHEALILGGRTDYLENIKQDRHTYLSSQRGKRTLTLAEHDELCALDRASLPQRLAKALSTLEPARKHYDAHVDLYRARMDADRAIMGLVGGIV